MALQITKSFPATGEIDTCYVRIATTLYPINDNRAVVVGYFFNKSVRENNGNELNRENFSVPEEIGDSREATYEFLKTLPGFENAINV